MCDVTLEDKDVMNEDGEKDGETEVSNEKESISTGKELKVKAAFAGELKKRDSESQSFENHLVRVPDRMLEG